MATRCVFIDETVQNSQTLLAGLEAGDICYRLDRQRDGLHQIAATLAGYRDLDALLIFAHGEPGAIQLGNVTLTQDGLARYPEELAAIGRALTPDGGIQFYACDLGRGRKGEAFVAAIEKATGVPCATSSTPVGHADLGGSWSLDVGTLSTPIFANPHWLGTLGLTVTDNGIASPERSGGEWRNRYAFAALRADGSVVTWGYSERGGDSSGVASQLNGTIDVTQIFSTDSAFAALRADGSVVTWGDSSGGGDSSGVAGQLNGTIDVTLIFSTSGSSSTSGSFAALRADGSVVTWGDSDYGGDSSAVASQLNGTIDVTQIFSTHYAFAALRADGSVITWGESSGGGDSSGVASQLNGTIDVTQIFSTCGFFSMSGSFAALRADGSVVTWGESSWGGDSSGVASQLNGTIDVTQIFSTSGSFAALRADGSVVTWGESSWEWGSDSSEVASQLNGTIDVTQIFSTDYAFAALRADGSVITWGLSSAGGNSSGVASQLNGTIDVTQIFSTGNAFAALRADGSVVTWGGVGTDYDGNAYNYGGDSSGVASQLNGTIDVTKIFSTGLAFAALRADGSVVTWGGVGTSWGIAYNCGGDSSGVASQLNGTIDVTQIFSTDSAFAALRADGSVITWGFDGGDSSAVAGQLTDVVSMANPYTDDVYRADTNIAPVVSAALSDRTITEGRVFSFTLPAGSFTDADGNTLSYRATLSNGSALPSWLSFNTTTRTFSGTAPLSSPNYTIRVTANDGQGGSVFDDFGLTTTTQMATLAIAASTPSRAEGNSGSTSFTFTVTRSGNSAIAASAAWSVIGSGSNPANAADFLGNRVPSGTVAFTAGQTSQTITINVAGDRAVEASEGFTVALSAPSANTTITTSQASSVIQNDDILPASLAITATTASRAEGNSGSIPFTFTVTRSGNSAIAASAAWSVTGSGGNPANAADFLGNVLPSGTVSFAAGQTSQTITVKVAGDRAVEASEGFTVALSAPSANTTITTAVASGVIQDDDRSIAANAITMTAVDGDNHTREDGGLATYRLSLNTPLTDGSLKIELTSQDPSEGLFQVDGQHTSDQTIVFDATHQSATVTVWGVQDYDPDGSASYQIQARASAGSTPPTSATGSWTSAIRTFNGGTSASNAHHETLYNDPDLTPDGRDRDNAVYLVGDQTGPTDDHLVGYDGPDRLYGQFMPDLLDGGIGDDRLYGGYDDDILYGRNGNDKLYGEQDDDYLNGGAGNDTLDGGTGADTMVGGVGNDIYYVDDAEDIVNDQGAATDIDTIIITETIRYTLPSTVENASLDSDSGNSGLIGNALKNILTGNDDNNKLSGGAGNDTLIGNEGNDILTGGLGADRLTGGDDTDIFRFAAPNEGGDTITDFSRGADKIQCVQSAFGGLTASQLAQGRLVCNATGTASGTGAQVIFNTRTGVLTYDGNGTGSGGATTIATLTIRTLAASDFQMVAS